MARFNDAPVPQIKIDLITQLLRSQPVNSLWLQLCSCPHVEADTGRSLKEHKHKLWVSYCKARDEFLGLPPRTEEQPQHERNLKQ
jgi:hypothetical protein